MQLLSQIVKRSEERVKRALEAPAADERRIREMRQPRVGIQMSGQLEAEASAEASSVDTVLLRLRRLEKNALEVPGRLSGPKKGLESLKEAVKYGMSKADWLSRARLRAVGGSTPKSYTAYAAC